jgi:hypothetical protein
MSYRCAPLVAFRTEPGRVYATVAVRALSNGTTVGTLPPTAVSVYTLATFRRAQYTGHHTGGAVRPCVVAIAQSRAFADACCGPFTARARAFVFMRMLYDYFEGNHWLTRAEVATIRRMFPVLSAAQIQTCMSNFRSRRPIARRAVLSLCLEVPQRQLTMHEARALWNAPAPAAPPCATGLTIVQK